MVCWYCQKCNLTWIYPIPKCPYCFSVIQKRISQKEKIIQTLETHIPSLANMQVPYELNVWQDEYGQKMIKKNRKYLMPANEVIAERIKYDFEISITRIFQGLNIIFKKSVSVLLVFEMTPKYPMYLGFSTNPILIESLVDLLQKNYSANCLLACEVIGEDCIKKLQLSYQKTIDKHKIKFFRLSEIEQLFIDIVIYLPVLKYFSVEKKTSLPAAKIQFEKKHIGFKQKAIIADGSIGQIDAKPAYFNVLIAAKEWDKIELFSEQLLDSQF